MLALFPLGMCHLCNISLSLSLCRTEKRTKKGRAAVKSKDWVLEKKERRRQEGRVTRDDSKYTARRRPGKF